MKDGNKDGADSGSNDIVKRGGDGICRDGVMRRALEHPCREGEHITVPADCRLSTLYTTASSDDRGHRGYYVILNRCFHEQDTT